MFFSEKGSLVCKRKTRKKTNFFFELMEKEKKGGKEKNRSYIKEAPHPFKKKRFGDDRVPSPVVSLSKPTIRFPFILHPSIKEKTLPKR